MLSQSDLHEYQRKAISFIKREKRCLLAIEMGLGKTISALTATPISVKEKSAQKPFKISLLLQIKTTSI